MTDEEKRIITEYFEKCGAKVDGCLERIEKEDLISDFLEYAKNGDKISPCGLYTIVAYGGF